MKYSIIFLGTRGSVPVSGSEFIKYGGYTSSVLVLFGDEAVVFDAGTGFNKILKYLPSHIRKITLFISHLHLDHIQGLLLSPLLFNSNYEVLIYAPKHNGLSFEKIFERIMSPPIWPVTKDVFLAGVKINTYSEEEIKFGDYSVDIIKSNHPDCAYIFKLKRENKIIVYASDYEHDFYYNEKLIEFSQNADLIIYDSQYFPEDYKKHIGFGHSTWEEGLKLAESCNAKNIAFFHHSPSKTDVEIDREQELINKIKRKEINCFFAKTGEEINI